MGWKIILSILFFLFVVASLVFYWLIPFRNLEFTSTNGNNNFSIGDSNNMQFYQNMRFPESAISYRIEECPLNKKNDMEEAFDFLSKKTNLTFYPVTSDEKLYITCDSKIMMDEEGLFIAGEGGPVNITTTDLFNVIYHSKIMLVKESTCFYPNIAIHELLHSLGFDHSANSVNIMYYLSNCDQVLGQDTIGVINNLYSIPSEPDLTFVNVSAKINGRYLDTDLTIKNNGLKMSQKAEIILYSDNQIIKKIDVNPISVGSGVKMSLKNSWVSTKQITELKFYLNTSFKEINKNNNELTLKVSR
ncbi:MAG: CARDB domain-containing protein [archaeon]|nr:CARDB domain-containing protein [archaeon]